MKVLIIGGAGYIGSHAVLELQQQGHDVVVFDNFENGHKKAFDAIREFTGKEVAYRAGDLKKKEDIDTFIKQHQDADIVMHFAAYIEVGESVQDPLKYYQNNVTGSMNLFESMLAYGLKKIVFSSTAAVYQSTDNLITEETTIGPLSPYGSSKIMVERILDDLAISHNLSSIRLRYFNVAGASGTGIIGEDHPHESHLIPLILATALGKREKISIYGDDYPTPDGTCLRDYIHVDDLIGAHILAMSLLQKQDMHTAMNLGSKQGFSVKEVIDECKKVSGVNFKVELHEKRGGDAARLVADSSKAQKELRWKPERNLHDIIQSAWDWHKNHPLGYGE